MGVRKPSKVTLRVRVGATGRRGKQTETLSEQWLFKVERHAAEAAHKEWCERTGMNGDTPETYFGKFYANDKYDRISSRYFRLVLLCFERCAFQMNCKRSEVTMCLSDMALFSDTEDIEELCLPF